MTPLYFPLVSDFYSAYSILDCPKQKCLTHLLRELVESAEKSPRFAGGAFFPRAKRLIKEMLLVKRQLLASSGASTPAPLRDAPSSGAAGASEVAATPAKPDGKAKAAAETAAARKALGASDGPSRSPSGELNELNNPIYCRRVRGLENRLEKLAAADYDEPHARRIAKRMRKYRKELTAFLWDKNLEGTNNAAERAIRPMVVARKISGGSRSQNGAAATAKLASLLRTASQQGLNLLSTVKSMLKASWAASQASPAMPTGP